MFGLKKLLNKPVDNRSGERIVRTCCPAHNCGGRCLLVVTVKNGVITRITTDDREEDSLANPQRRACTRGLSYLQRQYHPDRLKTPMKRIGKRGEGIYYRGHLENRQENRHKQGGYRNRDAFCYPPNNHQQEDGQQGMCSGIILEHRGEINHEKEEWAEEKSYLLTPFHNLKQNIPMKRKDSGLYFFSKKKTSQ